MKRAGSTLPSGFSLLEILLALSLTVVLTSAIGVAVNQAWRLSVQGQTELQRQQVARAVLRIMERDLRSVMFVPPSEFADEEENSGSSSNSTAGTNSISGSKTSSASTGGNGTTSTTTGGANSTGNSAASTATGESPQETRLTSRGIRGDQFSLELDGARPQQELAYALPVNAAIPSSRTSDLRTIVYGLAGPGQAADPQGRGGLARKEGDRYAIVSAEILGQSSTGSFSATVLAPEIVALEFRYFDGMMWHASWDSVSAGRLPRAVEVMIRFAPPEQKRAAWLNAAVNRSTETARLVIFVPAADPVPEETES